MDLLDTPEDFVEAVKSLQGKRIFPTTLSSAEISDLDASIRRLSILSARNDMVQVLDVIKDAVGSVLQPKTVQRADRVTPENPQGNVTTGLNPATARSAIRQSLKDAGYTPKEGEAGTIKDLSSDARIDLVVKTNVQLAQGAGHFIQGNANQDAVDLYPAWELKRFEDREVPRGEKMEKGVVEPDPENSHEARFRAAAEAAGDDDAIRILDETGRMIARKDSPLWEELGNGAGGYTDALGNPFDPFWFNTGMGLQARSRKECLALGLPVDNVQPQKLDFGNLFNLEDAS